MRKLHRYKAAGWCRNHGETAKPVWNRDYLRFIDEMMVDLRVVFVYRGHSQGGQLRGDARSFAIEGMYAARRAAGSSFSTEPELYLCNNPYSVTVDFVPTLSSRYFGALLPPPDVLTENEVAREAKNDAKLALGRRRAICLSGGYQGVSVKDTSIALPDPRYLDARVGTHGQYHDRVRRQAGRTGRSLTRGRNGKPDIDFAAKLFKRASTFRVLRVAFAHGQARSGGTDGVDGQRAEDFLNEAERWKMLRGLREGLREREGTYRPGRLRRIEVPKRGRTGTRPIDIPNLCDRLVETAVNRILTPLLDPLMAESSCGFRPGRGVRTGLARFERHVMDYRLRYVVCLDLKAAFSRVPRSRLLDAARPLLADPQMIRLVEMIIDRPLPEGGGIRKRQGIAQSSPLLLNLYLTRHLDLPWAEANPGRPCLRYADDLVLLAEEPDEARAAAEFLLELLAPHGLISRKGIKVKKACCRRRGRGVGFHPAADARVARHRVAPPTHPAGSQAAPPGAGPGPRHQSPAIKMAELARPVLRPPGHGPVETVDALLAPLYQLLSVDGLRLELPRDETAQLWLKAHRRWLFLRHRVKASTDARETLLRDPRAPPLGTEWRDRVDATQKIARIRQRAG